MYGYEIVDIKKKVSNANQFLQWRPRYRFGLCEGLQWYHVHARSSQVHIALFVQGKRQGVFLN